MIVFVTTASHFEAAFNQLIKTQSSAAAQSQISISKMVFDQFMQTPSARFFHKRTGLLSFTLDQWVIVFRRWVDTEIERSPGSEEKIRTYSDGLLDLMHSRWAWDNKLLVKECLDDGDFAELQ